MSDDDNGQPQPEAGVYDDWFGTPSSTGSNGNGNGGSPFGGNTGPNIGGGTRYGLFVLDAEVEKIHQAPNGTRNDTLNTAAFNCGQLVARGDLDRAHTEQALTFAARAVGLDEPEISNTLKSGLDAGVSNPRPDDRVGSRSSATSSSTGHTATGGATPGADPYVADHNSNKRRFLDLYGDQVRYCYNTRQWLVWDGLRWQPDESNLAYSLAEQAAEIALGEALTEPDDAQRKRLTAWAHKSNSYSMLGATLDLAAIDRDTVVSVDALDADVWLLNTRNGVIDLQTGGLGAHNREQLITKVCGVEYNPQQPTPRWLAFLETVLPDPDVRLHIQRQLGLALVGKQINATLPIAHGEGQNGKSTLLNILLKVLGDYAIRGHNDLLLDSGGHTEHVADLQGRRLVVLSESEHTSQLNEATVKSLTGGDRVRARRLYGHPYEFDPSHTFILATNHMPTIKGTDPGIWRRISKWPFEVRVPDEDIDPYLADRVYGDEGGGVLAWLVAGCLDALRYDREPPEAVVLATAEYRAGEDHFAQFLADECLLGAHWHVGSAELMGAYRGWCTGMGVQPMDAKGVGAALRQHGCTPGRTKHSRQWQGVTLASQQATP